MTRFNLTIESDSAAFADDPAQEIARILHGIIANLENSINVKRTMFDINGNSCGFSEFKVESE